MFLAKKCAARSCPAIACTKWLSSDYHTSRQLHSCDHKERFIKHVTTTPISDSDLEQFLEKGCRYRRASGSCLELLRPEGDSSVLQVGSSACDGSCQGRRYRGGRGGSAPPQIFLLVVQRNTISSRFQDYRATLGYTATSLVRGSPTTAYSSLAQTPRD